jgi:4-hydroxy-tetrahydrodipicolinate reductase
MRLLLVGYGRMGKIIEQMAPDYGFEVAGYLDIFNNVAGAGVASAPDADVAIDFSIPSAVVENLPLLAARGTSLVIGTTGWQAHEADMRRIAAEAGIGVVAASNFSLGANLFQILVEQAGALFAGHPAYGAWVYEIHHAAKQDAPSGTALTLKFAMQQAGYDRPIDVASSRAGSVPGTHTVGFDGPFETVTLTHANRDRAAFAQGALEAARWVCGRRGWFGIRDVLGLEPASGPAQEARQ